MDLEDEEYLHSKLRNKGKCQTYLTPGNVLELKPRTRRQGKCLGAALEVLKAERQYLRDMENAQKPVEYTYLSNDIWFQLSQYIAPEDVQRYALICKQSASSTQSRGFWLNLYRKYCNGSMRWNLKLPHQLQLHQLIACDKHSLRERVVQALYLCHEPFKNILEEDYKLDWLVGRTYVACWHLKIQCVWIMCYKFRSACIRSMPTSTETEESGLKEQDVANDWELLAEEFDNSKPSRKVQQTNDYDGVSMLMICSKRYTPFPTDFLYAANTSVKLAAGRERLSSDMRSRNLELDFISSAGNQMITWIYNDVEVHKVFPWWHPDFSKFNKCH